MATQYRKAEKPKIIGYFPTKAYGQDGDTVVVKMRGKGVFFCVRAGGSWYAQTTMQPLSKINTAYIKDLQSDKLTLKRIENAGLDTDKFIVLKDNSIKYRTGDDILDDLDVFASKKINFKTAYCSLGQYSDKESCETNGGTWYYSENDSHDSISSTPENQLLTTGQEIGTMDSEPTLLYDGSTLEIKYNSDYDDNWQTSAQTDLLKLSNSNRSAIMNLDSDGDLTLDVDGDIELNADGGDVKFNDGIITKIGFDLASGRYQFFYDLNNFFRITVGGDGVTSLNTTDEDGAVGHLTLAPDGDLVLDPASQKTIINATDGLYFDGGGDTYIYEQSADALRVMVGGDILMQISEKGDDGNEVNFASSCVGFTQLEPTYNAVATTVDFRHSNKQNLTFGAGSITNVQLYFPLVSGNFQLLIKQDGTGSRTITNYKVYEFDESLADGDAAVKWAGGSNPTLTTDANHVDILSFYWDADNEIAYGVATLDFQF